MTDAIAAALEPLRTGFRADGADIELASVSDGVVVIRLTILDDACEDECILPKRSLESIFLATLSRVDPQVRRVDVIDPRLAPGRSL